MVVKNDDNRLNIYLLLSLIVIMTIGLVACQTKTYEEPEMKSDILVSGCKIGECSEYIDKQNDLKVTFKCLGEMKGLFYWNNKTILLDDGNVLIYQQGSTFPGELYIKKFKATLFIINKLIFKPIYISYYEHGPNLFRPEIWDFDYIILPDNKYLLNQHVIYYDKDLKNDVDDSYFKFIKERKYQNAFITQQYIVLPNRLYINNYGCVFPEVNEIEAYEQIIKTMKYPLRKKIDFISSDASFEIMFVKTLNHKYNLFAGNCKGCDDIWKDCDAIWLEDPVALKRSKYGKLTSKVNYLAAEMVSEDQIYLISAGNIELFNPDTGEVTLITKYPTLKNKPKTLLLKDKKIFILGPGSKVYMIFDPVKNEIITTGKIDSLFDDGDYSDTYDMTLLKDGKVLIYGLTATIYDPEKNKIYDIKGQLTQRMGAQLTTLKDGSVLITGGFLDIELAKRLLNKDEGFVYNSAESLSIEDVGK